ncbi:uncharacterized protein B0T15DRAFT_214951 [Chaetomium strumarium]|uniref:Uncharacterized protein n=1 Tax=Chaetomium strumarium TaxID=1170767 RepID=A0AAJ0M1V9_9PEZI|nr:hypothetical protein B0T15DRAFT_214951 [Chaetomium strumarium]
MILKSRLSALKWCIHKPARRMFRKWFIRRDMPWLCELWELWDEELERGEVDYKYKAVYMSVNEATSPRYGIGGPFRRIWGICDQMAPHYHGQIPKVRTLDTPKSTMLRSTVCRHILSLTDEQVPDSSDSLQRTLFFYSQEGPEHRPVILELVSLYIDPTGTT